eukprot:592555_1
MKAKVKIPSDDRDDNPMSSSSNTTILVAAAGCIAAATGVGLLQCYTVCKPNQFLVRTGLMDVSMSIRKKGIVLPWVQRGVMVDMNPSTYRFNLQAMSKGNVEFKLPVVYTVGPQHPEVNRAQFETYATLMTETSPDSIETTIKGIVEGETRIRAAQLTVDEMFSDRERFREHVVDQITPELTQLGLVIYNATIQEMHDYDENNKFFEYRKQRAIQNANNEARAAVAEAQKKGDIAVAERKKDTDIRLALVHKEQTVYKNEQDIEIAVSDTKIAEAQAQQKRLSQIANVEAENAIQLRDQELALHVENTRREREIASKRAEIWADALVQSEAKERVADANYYAKEREAAGMKEILSAQANGLGEIYEASGRNAQLAQFYLGSNSDLYVKLAEKNAEAIQGLNPNIQIWNTGANGNETNDVMLPFVSMIQKLNPLMNGLQEQAHWKFPDFIPQPSGSPNASDSKKPRISLY